MDIFQSFFRTIQSYAVMQSTKYVFCDFIRRDLAALLLLRDCNKFLARSRSCLFVSTSSCYFFPLGSSSFLCFLAPLVPSARVSSKNGKSLNFGATLATVTFVSDFLLVPFAALATTLPGFSTNTRVLSVGVVGPSGEFYRCTIILGYF